MHHVQFPSCKVSVRLELCLARSSFCKASVRIGPHNYVTCQVLQNEEDAYVATRLSCENVEGACVTRLIDTVLRIYVVVDRNRVIIDTY